MMDGRCACRNGSVVLENPCLFSFSYAAAAYRLDELLLLHVDAGIVSHEHKLPELSYDRPHVA